MRKIFTLLFLLVFISARSQKPGKRQARKLIKQAIEHLKNGDSLAFASMWLINSEPWPYHNRYFCKEDVNDHFKELRSFLDTALTQNLKADGVEIESICNDDEKKGKHSRSGCRYNIRTTFKYGKHYYKGFGINVEYVGNRWACRFEPDYTIIYENRDKG